ncbi:MAG: 1-(5-phosphoribosyl)-5-[(5-phosphoribosylamino)methylideneamino]imidazole-4-carboxamide isomerase [Candidatus Omnitrophica bacterium]|nr:1-(5-phosphoribosyl)-5-[(5-phosphoribosylamino)methylideneamino]imidazole-4-carboxamide isomerase [Candidatus Omnitrophota bacterium]
MILIPAIDILGGKCVRLYQGDYNQVTEYADDPVAQAKVFQAAGAKRIHLVDLDGAKNGDPINEEIILRVANEIETPIEIGGGIRSLEQVQKYLSGGVDRVILGTAAIRNPNLLIDSAMVYPGRVYVGIDAKDGRVAVQGWTEDSGIDAFEFAKQCEDRGAGGIIFTDIARDGAMVGPNLESLRKMAETTTLNLIASGGISSLEDLKAIRDLGLDSIEGIITGKAVYSGAFTVEEGIAAVGG